MCNGNFILESTQNSNKVPNNQTMIQLHLVNLRAYKPGVIENKYVNRELERGGNSTLQAPVGFRIEVRIDNINWFCDLNRWYMQPDLSHSSRNVWNLFKLGESEKNVLKRISVRGYTVKNQIKCVFIRNCTLLFTFLENM
jgi:hypothetical protein